MLQNIVKESVHKHPSGNPFAQMNTLQAILDDSKKDEVSKFVQKYPTVPQTSASSLEKSQKTVGHSSPYELTDENTATSLQDRIPTRHPAHQKKEEISGECQKLMEKFDGTKKERLEKILIDDYTVAPPNFTTQFLQDYYLKLNEFLSMLNDTEKDTFWGFREAYEKYSGLAITNSLTQHQFTQSGINFVQKKCKSERDRYALISMHMKVGSSPEAENKSRRANHRRTMIFISNFDRTEIWIYFRMIGYIMNNV
ncbi:hypothetical protein PSTG_14842 [Puccinia striiformis f. sp. tritici PST-78]|uniref:Uncharacterized protein n=1 Tax=Puccinia striiformis f. sp. tritici PST-78 TaxID=1165861 RepID=A0A0L0UXG1_9BASI|nr:hypothetical protein PSTG_14842 [Puccinia striiformis f. sp. tritici PST-78]